MKPNKLFTIKYYIVLIKPRNFKYHIKKVKLSL